MLAAQRAHTQCAVVRLLFDLFGDRRRLVDHRALPDYRLPKSFFFIDALSKNDRGKVRRDDLKAQWQRDHVAA